MLHTLIGTKVKQTQAFDKDGYRMPVTVISAGPCWVTQIKSADHDGYAAVQLGFGSKRNLTKPQRGHLKKAGLTKQAPRFFREVKVDESVISEENIKPGDTITLDQVFTPGDEV